MRTGSSFTGETGKTDQKQKESRRSYDGSGPDKLYVIGIGPGDIEYLSLKAYKLLQQVEVVVGYTTYIELIDELLSPDQQIISTGMGGEKERAEKAIARAAGGHSVAVISSGDPGVYGMAGLILEILQRRKEKKSAADSIEVEIVPGITASTASASALGAPLMHDHAVISLSDLLTPWDKIKKRITAAASSDMITALYNPRSSQRTEQIKIARDIFLDHRSPETPVGIVRSARRGEDEEVVITCLKNMLDHRIDMLSTVIIGNSSTYVDEGMMLAEDGAMITPRGYEL